MTSPHNIALYPYFSPIILTDDLFVQYGGLTGTSTVGQRTAAYMFAEQAVSLYIPTFLTPTIVTGTYQLSPTNPIFTDWMYVNNIEAVTLYSRKRDSSCTFSTNSSCTYLRNAKYGILDVRLVGNCGCNYDFHPYFIEVAYNAGLASGTVYNSTIMGALAAQANEELKEITNTSATPGGVGIKSWANQEYREERMDMKKTSFGSTAIAQKVTRYLKPFALNRYSGL